MTNENDTVVQVALSDLPLEDQIRIIRDNYSIGSGEFDALDEAADVVECNQREISGLKGERKCILKANELLAADNTRLRDELAAKDAMIVDQSKVNDAQAAQLRDALNEIEAKDRQLESASADAEAEDAEIDKLKFDNMRLKSEQRTSGEVIIEQTNKIEAKDAEIEKLKNENARLRVIVSGATVADGDLREEIVRLRALVKGLLDASSISCADCKYGCYSDHSNCIIQEAANYIKKGEVEND